MEHISHGTLSITSALSFSSIIEALHNYVPHRLKVFDHHGFTRTDKAFVNVQTSASEILNSLSRTGAPDHLRVLNESRACQTQLFRGIHLPEGKNPTNDMKPELFVVIQEGGTSNEQYLHCFNSKGDANHYVKECLKVYSCIGPFELPVPEIADLARAANDALRWLRDNKQAASKPALKLEKALTGLAPEILKQLRLKLETR